MMCSNNSRPRYTLSYILIALLLFVSANMVYSQASSIPTQTSNSPTVEMRVQRINQLLNLTPIQQKRYAKFLVQRDTERNAFAQKVKSLPPDEAQKLQMELKTKFESQLQQILTPQQYKKLNDEAAKLSKPQPAPKPAPQPKSKAKPQIQLQPKK